MCTGKKALFPAISAVLVVGALLICLPSAYAAAKKKSDQNTIAEVVVTARKRQEPLQNVPMDINVMSNAQIQRYQASDLTQITAMVNDVEITPSKVGNGGTFLIRGIGALGGDKGIEQSVAIDLDGVQTTRGYVSQLGMFDLRSVQILKGPQALYYGKDATAGVISIESALPTDQFQAYLRAGYEFTAKERILEGAISGPLTDTLKARLAVWYDQMRGWVYNTAGPIANSNGQVIATEPYNLPGASSRYSNPKQHAGRLSLAWQPTTNLRVLARFMIMARDDDGQGTDAAGCSTGNVFKVATVGAGILTDPWNDCKPNYRGALGFPPKQVIDNWSIPVPNKYFTRFRGQVDSIDVSWDVLPWLTIHSLTGWYQYGILSFDNYSGSSFDVLMGVNDEWNKQYSQELRISTHLNGPVNFMAGIYADGFDRYTLDSSKLFALGPDPLTGHSNDSQPEAKVNGDSQAVFAEAMWNITENLELDVGGRYTWDKQNGKDWNQYVNQLLNGIVFLPEGEVVIAHPQSKKFQPEVTLTWRPSQNYTIWGAFKTGYKVGGFANPIVLSPNYKTDTQFGPESVSGGEFGIKSLLLSDSLRFNATVYWYKYKNLQVNRLNNVTITFSIGNAASATTKGAEFETEYRITPNVTIQGQVGYNDAKFDSYPNASCYTFEPTGPNQCINGEYQNLSGDTLADAPKWNGSLSFDFVHDIAFNWEVHWSVDGIYTSGYKTVTGGQPAAYQSAFWRLRTNVSLQSPDGKWDISLIGRNLTDQQWPIGGTRPGAVGLGDQTIGTPRPRSWLVRVTRHWQ